MHYVCILTPFRDKINTRLGFIHILILLSLAVNFIAIVVVVILVLV